MDKNISESIKKIGKNEKCYKTKHTLRLENVLKV